MQQKFVFTLLQLEPSKFAGSLSQNSIAFNFNAVSLFFTLVIDKFF